MGVGDQLLVYILKGPDAKIDGVVHQHVEADGPAFRLFPIDGQKIE